jgi:hypothetical protein
MRRSPFPGRRRLPVLRRRVPADRGPLRDTSAVVILRRFCGGNRSSKKRRDKDLEAKFRGGFSMFPAKPLLSGGHQKAGGIVQPFPDQLGQQDFVALSI